MYLEERPYQFSRLRHFILLFDNNNDNNNMILLTLT